jgi:predicted DNA-binding antitoxin AbrB/MazE fold protein
MSITIEAVYENGMLRPTSPLPLREFDKVQVTVHAPIVTVPETSTTSAPPGADVVGKAAGLIPCVDTALIERIALDPALEYGD